MQAICRLHLIETFKNWRRPSMSNPTHIKPASLWDASHWSAVCIACALASAPPSACPSPGYSTASTGAGVGRLSMAATHVRPCDGGTRMSESPRSTRHGALTLSTLLMGERA
eukprot:5699056-Pleurochrysis_carterae.AAC.5